MSLPVSIESPYPLDKNRELLNTWTDVDGAVYKVFRLFAQDGSSIDVEFEVREPKPKIRVHAANARIVAQEKDDQGYLIKLVMAEEGGEIKEYWMEEKLPQEFSKRKVHLDRSGQNKKRRTETSKNLVQLLKEYPVSDEFLLLLSKTHVQEFPMGRKEIIIAEKEESVGSAWKKMIDNDILSMPVLNQDNTWFGFLDILDVVTWLVDLLGEQVASEEDLDITSRKEFLSAKVKDIMSHPKSKRNPFHQLFTGASLLSAVEILSKKSHRVAILDENGKLENIITQSAVMKFISEHMNLLGAKRNMPISDLYLSNQYVLSVTSDEKAIDGFRLIRLAQVTGIAVIDHEGKLVGNLSARDLRKIATSGKFMSRLFKPASEFLEGQQAIVARPEESLETVIKRIVEHKLHRIYLVDNDGKLTGLVSLTDILEELLS